jgi:1-acyl-sn-glycerol-3-phosphate acyltransferase
MTTVEQHAGAPVHPALSALGRTMLNVLGWELVGEAPEEPKYLVIGAPHTSNWDFIHIMPAILGMGVNLRWLAKASLFRPPLGWLMTPLGGMPVDRSKSNNLVEQVAEAYKRADQMAIALLPEGTRSYTDHWKSGFYHMALAADVPVVLAFCDYENKRVGAGPTIHLTGDISADMDRIRAFYSGIKGKYPDQQGPIRLRAEGLN